MGHSVVDFLKKPLCGKKAVKPQQDKAVKPVSDKAIHPQEDK